MPEKLVRLVHDAVLLEGGAEDTASKLAKGWVGTTEDYTLSEQGGVTTLVAQMTTTSSWKKMFADAWPTMLACLKAICER